MRDMAGTPEAQPLVDQEKGTGPTSWPVVPEASKNSRNALFCWPWCCCVPCAGALVYGFLLLVILLCSVFSLVAGLFCGLPVACFFSYTWYWRFPPGRWRTDLYEKMMYLVYYATSGVGSPAPVAGPDLLPVSGIVEKKTLEKVWIDYALNIKVPVGNEEQFTSKSGRVASAVETNMTVLPFTDRWDGEQFGPEENVVEFAMNQLGVVYPNVYQEWPDKHSDDAHVRMALCGLGAKRIDLVTMKDKKFYVVKTNMLATLPVREGFERYGGDAYFDMDWKPVMIKDKGLGKMEVTTYPGQQGWEKAKFRWRSSLFTLVTLVDHLYGLHLQNANLFVTALREQMSANHPIRRFLTPFTYKTIHVNDNAAHNLAAPRSMGPRCFSFTDKGMQMAFSAAPSLVRNGQEVPVDDGGPILNIPDYVAYLKKQGIDTEYWRQAAELCMIFEQFLRDYLPCYYPTEKDLVLDKELALFAHQYFKDLEGVSPANLSVAKTPYTAVLQMDVGERDFKKDYEFYVKWMATLLWFVTGGHEQDGAIEVYAQDVSWTSWKWCEGQSMGNKQTATAQALLMSFTSTPMPKLLGADWVHLFPPSSKDPKKSFETFQQNLKKMAEKCDAYNDQRKPSEKTTRAYADRFPVYVNNPKVLEISISV